MPNGEDRNLRRLLMACAVYRQKYREWPSQARLHPGVFYDFLHILESDQFEKLAAHLELRTKPTMGISVGGRGVVEYDEVDHERLDGEMLELAEKWLDVRTGLGLNG